MKDYDFELEGPWSRILVGTLDVLIGWCCFWSCATYFDAQANGRALERIEKRLDAAHVRNAGRRVAQDGRKDGVENLAKVAEKGGSMPSVPLVECHKPDRGEAIADENGFVLAEGFRLTPLDHATGFEFSGDDCVRPAELDASAGRGSHHEKFVVLFVHGTNSTARAEMPQGGKYEVRTTKDEGKAVTE